MNENEINYWKKFLDSLELFPPETTKEARILNFFEELIYHHIDRLENTLTVDNTEYRFVNLAETDFLDEIGVQKPVCNFCSLCDKCGKDNEPEYCINPEKNWNGNGLFRTAQEWFKYLAKSKKISL